MVRNVLLQRFLAWGALPLILIGALAAWFALDPGFRWDRHAPDLAVDLPQDEFGRRVRAYLLEHPEVIMEAASRFEDRQRAAQESEAEAILKSRAEEVFRDADSPVGGNPQGDVSLVEFFDYNCPYCRQVAPVMHEAEVNDPRLRVVYKEFPILGPNSIFAAKAALAAHKQGKYLAFHRSLFEGRGSADASRVMDVASKIGLDIERLKADMADSAIEKAIAKNIALAQALRIDGTPGFVIGNKILRGATDLKVLQALVGEARAGH